MLQNDYNSKMEDKRKLEAALKNPTAPENRKIVEGQNQASIDAHDLPRPDKLVHNLFLSFQKAAKD